MQGTLRLFIESCYILILVDLVTGSCPLGHFAPFLPTAAPANHKSDLFFSPSEFGFMFCFDF